MIKEIDGKLTAIKDKETKNIDVGTVLLKYFGVKSLVAETVQKNLKQFTKLKLKDELSIDGATDSVYILSNKYVLKISENSSKKAI
ncbi:MAG: hypothetical protein GY834_07255 [Bacteroidetes bacterium]|nr:hypothetical protein [Bacteroidota bacterium]